MPHKLSRENIAKDPNRAEAAKVVWGFHRMPKLLYVPFVWGPRDQAQWDAIPHDGELINAFARSKS